MAVTAEQIARLRRMIAEPTTATYSDADLTAAIERYPLVDENGNEPRIPSSTVLGTLEANADWVATYDLNAAAADLWAEKASGVAQDFAFSADGANFSRNQVYDQYMRQSRFYAARKSPRTIKSQPQPKPTRNEILFNQGYVEL